MKIAIIGAGPAGATAAVRLARAGAAVLLFDPSHPREKPCGGGLTGRALALVSDIIDISSLPSVVVKSATVEGPQQATRAPLIDRGATCGSSLLIFSRTVFDQALATAAIRAGARFIAERAVHVVRRRAHMVVTTDRGEYDVDHVLGADGANSVVRKQLARPFARAELSVAAGYFVGGETGTSIFITTTREQPGYLWSFPRPDHSAVGICAPATHHTAAPALRAQSATWIRQHGFDPLAPLTPYSWPIPSVGGTARRDISLSGPGWMLLGDAAGLVDPLTREGIYYALLSARNAAEALVAAPASSASTRYEEFVLGAIQPELARAAKLCRLFFNPGFSPLLVRALEESEGVREVFADLVGGVQPYRGLRRRLLTKLRWSLAAQAIPMLLQRGFAGTIADVALPSGNVTRS
jgi:geranylgeranyl reductase family protein